MPSLLCKFFHFEPSPIGGVDGDIAQNFGLTGDSQRFLNAIARAQDAFGVVDRREVFPSIDDLDPAAGADAVAMTGAGDGQPGFEQTLHQVRAHGNFDGRMIFGKPDDGHVPILLGFGV